MAPELPAYLYHGTRAQRLPAILAYGLSPRRNHGATGNWRHSVQSNPRAVYLTNAYPLYFAGSTIKDPDEDLLILEVNVAMLDPHRLAPDEDFLEQVTRDNPDFAGVGAGMKARTRWFRHRALTGFAHHWRDSLAGLGTCAYFSTIPPTAITRWATIPINSPLVRASDPTINLMNYRIMGGYYRQLVRRIFGDDVVSENLGVMQGRMEQLTTLSREGVVVQVNNAYLQLYQPLKAWEN